MRIVAGKHRSRKLLTPETEIIRPTSDKVRQALFNALNSRNAVVDAVVLDIFCGTGALGLEALSQGAAKVIFIDKNNSSLDLARKNASALGETGNAEFFLYDATRLPERPASVKAASLVFLDPPYRQNLIPQAVSQLRQQGWLASDTMLVAEIESSAVLDLDNISIEFEKTYGDTKVIAFRFI